MRCLGLGIRRNDDALVLMFKELAVLSCTSSRYTLTCGVVVVEVDIRLARAVIRRIDDFALHNL